MKKLPIRIEQYTAEDWTDLKAVFTKNVPQYFGAQEIWDLEKYLEEYGSTYFIARNKEHLIGGAGYHLSSKTLGRISWIFFDPEYQRKGVGSRLLRHCLDRLKAQKISKMEVWTSQFGIQFFSKFDFVQKGYKENYWAPGIHLVKMQTTADNLGK